MMTKKSKLLIGIVFLIAAAGCGSNVTTENTGPVCGDTRCAAAEDCVNDVCVPKTDGTTTPECNIDGECKNGEVCDAGKCGAPVECSSEKACPDDANQYCDAGTCRTNPTTACTKTSCGDGKLCIRGKCLTATECQTSDTCKKGERCKDGACIDVTGKTDLCKTGFMPCGKGTRCEYNTCVPDCDDPCNGVCCDAGKTCFDNTCVTPCGKGEEMCGVGTSPECCNTATHGCFKNFDEATNTWLPDTCKPLGDKCNESQEKYCTIVRYCDSKYASCVKYDENPGLCLLPTVDVFNPVVKLEYSEPTYDTNSINLVSLPIVADLTGDGGRPDGWPDIAIVTYEDENYDRAGILRVIRGKPLSDDPKDVKEYWQSNRLVKDPDNKIGPFWANPTVSPAIGDLDGDRIPDIIVATVDASGEPNGFRAVSGGNGATIFYNKDAGTSRTGVQSFSISNLDNNGAPEIIHSQGLYDGSSGEKLCDLPNNVAPISADLDEDGNKEIILGTAIYSFERTPTGATCTQKNSSVGTPGALELSAVADIYPSLSGPEIVTVSASKNKLIVSDGEGNKLWDIALGGSRGGPPTIGDFDGDEKLEIAYADMNYYTIIKPADDPHTPGTKMWTQSTKDKSSGFTGSSIFDFDGDGAAEAVYYDEDYLRIYDGASGREKMKMDNSNLTGAEYPVIVDIDNDGHADVVMAGNTYSDSHEQTPGLRVITDRDNKWVSTRKIWNQHDYHYTNVNDDGTIPQNEKHHWKEAWSNTFRQNVQKGNNRLAPDVTVKFTSLYGATCDASTQRTLKYTLGNDGDKPIAAGAITNVLSVRVAGTGAYEAIDTRTNTQALNKGDTEDVTFDWQVPTKYQGQKLDFKVEADQGNAIIECREDNTVEETNVDVTAPNLAINFNQSPFCSSAGAGFGSQISFELSNEGAVPVAADGAEVTVKLTTKAGKPVAQAKVKNTEALTAKDGDKPYLAMTADLDIPQEYQQQALTLEISVKLLSGVRECNPDDNVVTRDNAVYCQIFG